MTNIVSSELAFREWLTQTVPRGVAPFAFGVAEPLESLSRFGESRFVGESLLLRY